ncbi:MAG: hypothetical protein JO202_19080 [Ktedonobacteraceae bacterium]|nr:hypothetical protein [Ktedonobacteraceae bacterium]
MWIVARYLPVAPFSLKSASATASGGKTLLVPTPYAIKMALLDAAIRMFGLAEGERLFPFLRDLTIAVALPNDLVVMKGFGKIQRLLKDKSNKEKAQEAQERKHWPMQPTIAYREYVYYRDAFQLAFAAPAHTLLPPGLTQLLLAINYFGKRGGFAQLLEPPYQTEELPVSAHFIDLTPTAISAFHIAGTLQMLDDCAHTLTFQRANIYTADRITLGKERILRHVVLPYRLQRSSRGYNWYQYIHEEG